MTERWARFNTETNALDNLEKVAIFLDRAKCNPEDWKWVVMSCFGALYGFAIQVAKGTDDLFVVRKTKKGQSRLITCGEAIEICQQAIGARGPLELSEEERESINLIQNTFRNNFEYFNPGSWSIEISGFPDHILNVLNVVRRLAIDHNFYTHLDAQEKERLNLAIRKCELTIGELREMYT